jgi:hypothetical protein
VRASIIDRFIDGFECGNIIFETRLSVALKVVAFQFNKIFFVADQTHAASGADQIISLLKHVNLQDKKYFYVKTCTTL